MGFFDKLKKVASDAMSNTSAEDYDNDSEFGMDKIDDTVNRLMENVDKRTEALFKSVEKNTGSLIDRIEKGFNSNKNKTVSPAPVQDAEAVGSSAEAELQSVDEGNGGKNFGDYIAKARVGMNKAIDYADKNPEVVAAAAAAGGLLAGFVKKKIRSRAESKSCGNSDDDSYSSDDDDYSYSSDDDDDNSYSSNRSNSSCKKSSSSGSSSKKSSSGKKSYGINSNVRAAEAKLNQAKNHLEIEKRAREQAKKNGNYKNSPKGGYEGHVGNAYDRGVYYAQKQVKQCQEELRRAKSQGK